VIGRDPMRAHRVPLRRDPHRLGAAIVLGICLVIFAVYGSLMLAQWLADRAPDTGPGPDPTVVVIDGREVRTLCIAPGLRGFTDPADRRLLATGDVDYGATRWGCP
jgi:hypothetical protein